MRHSARCPAHAPRSPCKLLNVPIHCPPNHPFQPKAPVCSAKIGQGAFKGILGLKPAEQAGVEDFDFSALVRSHGDWCKHGDHILHLLGLDAAAAETR